VAPPLSGHTAGDPLDFTPNVFQLWRHHCPPQNWSELRVYSNRYNQYEPKLRTLRKTALVVVYGTFATDHLAWHECA